MTTRAKTKIHRKATASNVQVKAYEKKAAKARAAPTSIVAKAIVGLSGQGLLRLGDKSTLELRDRLAMPRSMFGRIVNVSERTIAEAEAGEGAAKKLQRTYNEVYRLWKALSDVVDSECLGHWFQTPNESFDGLKPIEVIERGEIDRLWNMVFQLQTGMPG